MTAVIISYAAGILTTIIGVWLTHTIRDRRTRRMIARILIPDLKNLNGAMIFMGGPPVKWDSVEFPPTHWAKWREALAEAITDPKDWLTISSVFEGVQDLAEETKHHEWPEELDDLDQQHLEDLYQGASRALDVLHRYAGVPKPPRRVRRLRRRQRMRERLRSLRLA